MQPFATISEEDTLQLTGPAYLTDLIWRAYFGRAIEYRHRIIPTRLCYLLSKYGPVITHQFFVEDIQYSCAEYRDKPNSNETELVCLSAEKAGRLIDEAARLGLIIAYRSPRDERYKLWRLTDEQKQKLYKIKEATAQIDEIIKAQLRDPTHPLAGRNESNQEWHGNVVTDRLHRKDETFVNDKAKLARLQYLITGIFLGIMTATILLAPVLAMADGAISPK
jgi:hypothetical protein